MFGHSLTVGRLALNQKVEVRILVPEPFFWKNRNKK